jgi:hypothetical protein
MQKNGARRFGLARPSDVSRGEQGKPFSDAMIGNRGAVIIMRLRAATRFDQDQGGAKCTGRRAVPTIHAIHRK